MEPVVITGQINSNIRKKITYLFREINWFFFWIAKNYNESFQGHADSYREVNAK